MFVGRQGHVCRAAKVCLSGGKCMLAGRQRHVCWAAKAHLSCGKGMFVGRQRHVCRAAKACLSGGKCMLAGRQRHFCRAAKAHLSCGKGMFVGRQRHVCRVANIPWLGDEHRFFLYSLEFVWGGRHILVRRQNDVRGAAKACLSGGKGMFVGRQKAKACLAAC